MFWVAMVLGVTIGTSVQRWRYKGNKVHVCYNHWQNENQKNSTEDLKNEPQLQNSLPWHQEEEQTNH